MDRGDWHTTVHGAAKSQIQLMTKQSTNSKTINMKIQNTTSRKHNVRERSIKM